MPVTQVRTGYGRGQCTEASIASLLEVELEAVPDLWAGPLVPLDAPPEVHQPLLLCEALWRWLREVHQVVWCEVRFPAALELSTVPYAHGRAVRVLFGLDAPDAEPWTEHHVMFGANPAGISHCVVGRYGSVVHDPNPSRAGIVACSGLIFLIPLDRCPEDLPLAARWDLQMGPA